MPEKSDLTQSKSVQDFLKAVYRLQQQTESVSTNALAEELNVKAPSITDMAQRLVAAGMVDFVKDQILVQSATAMLAQANTKPQSVLQLFK